MFFRFVCRLLDLDAEGDGAAEARFSRWVRKILLVKIAGPDRRLRQGGKFKSKMQWMLQICSGLLIFANSLPKVQGVK